MGTSPEHGDALPFVCHLIPVVFHLQTKVSNVEKGSNVEKVSRNL